MTFATAYLRMARADAAAKMENRADFGLIMLGVISTSLASMLTVYFMLGASGTVMGWSRGEIIFMQGFVFTIFAPQSSCFNAMYWVEVWLKNGNFTRFYTRPGHPLLLLMLEKFHPQGFICLFTGLAYCVFGLWNTPYLTDWLFWIKFAIMLPFAAIVLLSINMMAVSSCFWFGESFAMQITVGKLTDMSRYPLELFPKIARYAFMALPLAGIVWWPSLALLRDANVWSTIALMGLIAVGSLYALHWQWKLGMRHWAGAGG